MTPRTPQCEVFWALLSNPKHSGVLKDSKSPTLGVLGFTPTLGQSGVATLGYCYNCYIAIIITIVTIIYCLGIVRYNSPLQGTIKVRNVEIIYICVLGC